YKDQFILNRIGLGGFIRSLEHLYKIQYNKNIKYKLIGKPASLIFDYAKSTVENINSKTLYMVGDNPEVDIQGGKNAGIKTILLKTGVHNKPENSTEYAADYFVDDVSKAVDLILKNHNL
ncbi:MAG: HAD hydrolase-like protein, partial [bacterium]